MPTAPAPAIKLFCLIAMLGFCLAWPSEGAQKRWVASTGGSWHDASNWENDSPPGPMDEARFYWWSNGTVTFNADATSGDLWIGSPEGDVVVTFDLNGHTYIAGTPYLGYSGGGSQGSGHLTILDGTLQSSIFGADVRSSVTLKEGGRIVTGRYSSVGSAGSGAFLTTTKILAGGELTANIFDASGASFSIVEVTGGVLNSRTAELGSGADIPTGTSGNPRSRMLVSGNGSRWNSTGDIDIVGSWNSITDYARLTVENHGRIFSSGDLSTTSEGQIHLLKDGLIQTNSLSCANGTLTLSGGVLYIDAADPAESQENPGRFSIGNATFHLGGPDHPVVYFRNGAYDAGLSTLHVGTSAGEGTLSLQSGSQLTTSNAAIGASDDGAVHVLGAGTEWTNSGNISVFFSPHAGQLSVSGGGKLTTGTLACPNPNVVDLQDGGTLVANRIANSFLFDAGTLSVEEVDGALAQSGGVFQPGTPYGAADISGYYNVSNGAIAMELAGTARGVDYDCLDVGGALTIENADLTVTLANGFVPQPGQTFDLFDAGSVSGNFAEVSLPPLPSGGKWIVDGLASDGVVQVNHPPTGTALTPQVVECVDGAHAVELSTTVGDGDGGLLDVTWSIRSPGSGTWSQVEDDGGLSAGEVASFLHDFPHGVSYVRVEVRDGYQTTYVETIVTVQDTAAPIVIVVADRTVPTDPGEAFATGVTLTPPSATDASGHPVTVESDAPPTFPLGETVVTWTAMDHDGNQATAEQKVTVVDRERPTIVPSGRVRTFCDSGKLFATVRLAPPEVLDNLPEGARIANDAGSRFKIGTTRVGWMATDQAGNVSRWTQPVIVVNRKPKANAGKNVTIVTTSERGVRVALDGRRSSDPDKHKLKYAWRAPRVRLSGAKAAKASGVFLVGQKRVKLTVTDAGGLRHADFVNVTVKLKNARRRPRGADANRSFAAAAREAGKAVGTNASAGATLSGLAYANAASAYGDAAGEFVRWEEGQSEEDALPAYAELRALQAAYGQAAARELLSAFAETGDESLLSAYGYAKYGTAYAAADLSEE